MKLSIERDRLLKPLGQVSSVVERRQTLPILGNVYLRVDDRSLVLTGTDLETEVTTQIDNVDGGDGECTVTARKFHDICRALPEDALIELEASSDRVRIQSGKSRFSLQTLAASNFPRLETEQWDCEFEVEQGKLKQLIENTAFSMAQQDVRYYLNGLLLETEKQTLRAVATDGHRLAMSAIEVKDNVGEPRQLIIPRKAVMELGRYLEESTAVASLGINPNHIRVKAGPLVFTSKLIDGRFPDYEKVIPKDLSTHLEIERGELYDILARAAILTNEKFKGVRLSLSSKRLSVSAHNPDQEEANDEMVVDYEGGELEIGFNVGYLMEALRILGGEKVDLGLQDPNSSCTVRAPGDETTIYLVMPMRL
jgi:DNA polymerase-3 subunit beta